MARAAPESPIDDGFGALDEKDEDAEVPDVPASRGRSVRPKTPVHCQ